jgi:hypothetical protein
MQTQPSTREEVGAVGATAKDEAMNVAHEVQQQARTALQQVQDDLRSRADQEAGRFAETLHATGRQLSSMADAADGHGVMPSVVREGAGAVERLGTRLDDGGIDAVMGDVRRWARRSPGSFLLGAAALGFVAGRVARHLSSNGTQSAASNGTQPTTAPMTGGRDR